jgi:hypothetical protein
MLHGNKKGGLNTVRSKCNRVQTEIMNGILSRYTNVYNNIARRVLLYQIEDLMSLSCLPLIGGSVKLCVLGWDLPAAFLNN